jgi:hypothetical protein
MLTDKHLMLSIILIFEQGARRRYFGNWPYRQVLGDRPIFMLSALGR